MAVRKYFYKNPDEIISQLNSYRGNIKMVWDAATEAAEEKFNIAQQPLSGSPEGSPKSAEPTSDNGKRCVKFAD